MLLPRAGLPVNAGPSFFNPASKGLSPPVLLDLGSGLAKNGRLKSNPTGEAKVPSSQKAPSPPREPRPSCSVILLDPSRGGDEPWGVYMLRRSGGSRFMPGRYVFPGGSLDPGDGPANGDEPARRRAALRELWEEAGVLLVEEPQVLAGLPAEELASTREALHQGRLGLEEALAGLGLRPRPQALIPWARWITPAARPQRFDTFFYLALMPGGQEADCDQQETSCGLWLGPQKALAQNLAGQVELAPPQVRMIGEMAAFTQVGDMLAAAPETWPPPVEPVLYQDKDQRMVLLPWDPDWEAGRPQSPAQACPAGQATRLVHDRGRWLPFAA